MKHTVSAWEHPHWFVSRGSQAGLYFNLDAPRPCKCGRDARDPIHKPDRVRAHLASRAES